MDCYRAALGGHGEPWAAEPAMFRADVQHSGAYAGTGVPQPPGVKWRFRARRPDHFHPAVAGGAMYFGSADHNVYAVDQRTGMQRWKFTTHGRVSSSPAVVDGRVYLGSYDGNLYALDAVSGKLLWKFVTEGERRFSARHLHGAEPAAEVMPDPFDVFLSSPVVSAGTVYLGSGDGNVYAVAADNGTLRWRFKTGNVVRASPALADGSYTWALGQLLLPGCRRRAQRWRFRPVTIRPSAIRSASGPRPPSPTASSISVAATRTCMRWMPRRRQALGVNGHSWVVSSPACGTASSFAPPTPPCTPWMRPVAHRAP
jgi:hypothetical protein